MSYSTDSGATWSEPSSAITTSTLSSGDTVLWKCSGLTVSTNTSIGTFSSTGNFEAEGNIMSLHFGDDFSGQTSLSGKNNAFGGLFANRRGITSAENLVLPATTLSQGCYYNMFKDCTSLTTAPVLSATTLERLCYSSMFSNCTSLNSITCLATDKSASQCTQSWVSGVAANGTFTKAASMSSWTEGTSGIPSGWTVVDYSG